MFGNVEYRHKNKDIALYNEWCWTGMEDLQIDRKSVVYVPYHWGGKIGRYRQNASTRTAVSINENLRDWEFDSSR